MNNLPTNSNRLSRIGSIPRTSATSTPITISTYFPPTSITSSVGTERYRQWLSRLTVIVNAYHKRLIPPKGLVHFQLFLLETGQFNANFIASELTRLNYPFSPFTITERHTYLRATDTWAMEMFRILYQDKHSDVEV
ncbi:MAG: hypothetical protein ACK4M7_04155, partial [Burkholderiales bacterium]